MNARAAGNERERIGRYPWWRRGGIVRATLTSIRTAGFRPLGGLITLQWIYYIFRYYSGFLEEKSSQNLQCFSSIRSKDFSNILS